MRTTLDIDDDVVVAVREIPERQRRSLGAMISELARRGLARSQFETDRDMPVVRVPAGSSPITPAMVRRAVDGD